LLELDAPPIRGLLISANNPAVTCPDAGKVRRGLARDDLFTVVHDPFLSVTARYADIVLPAATYLETEDLYRAYGTYYLQYAPRAIMPQGEAWSNFQLAQALARRMGVQDPVFNMSQAEILGEMLAGARGPVGALDPAQLRGVGPIRLATEGAQQFRTPLEKLEFYSEALAAQGLPPMPDWQPDPEDERQSTRWPLRLLTAPGYFQSHTAFSGVSFLRRREGVPCCILHPQEAAARNLDDGQRVRLFNGHGSVGLALKISDEIQPGVVLVPGQRPDGETISGTINMLCFRPLHRYRRRRHLPEHLARGRRLGERFRNVTPVSAAGSHQSRKAPTRAGPDWPAPAREEREPTGCGFHRLENSPYGC
jgi:anaerobic selenocysteine-containing dehydrogenase